MERKTPRLRLTLRSTYPALKQLTFRMKFRYNVVLMGTRTEMGLSLDLIETSVPWSRQLQTRRDTPIQAAYMFDQVVTSTLLAHTRRRFLVALHSRESAAIQCVMP